jgi:predicted enzyme related to lactoylglutathione lyase
MSTTGSFIWYELMTSDATAAAKFYGAVVGWQIADRSDPPGGDMDYRMIGRSDGGYNGGVISLTADMVQHGARPAWLGYLHVADVDAAVKAIEADGGRLLMPRKDLPVGAIEMGGGSVVNGPHKVPGKDWVVIAVDPQGAAFGVVGPQGASA